MKKVMTAMLAGTVLTAAAQAESLVVYFSKTGEQYAVGTITEGNTAKIAKIIAEQTGSDVFEIVPEKPYPEGYRATTDAAKTELSQKARPSFKGKIENFDQYDTIYLGYPNWWGDMPMVVYTFLETYSFKGKTIRPFCTHEGSGASGTKQKIAAVCKGAIVQDVLAVRGSVAQNDSAAPKKPCATG
ncbi:flavodoxin [Treponema brennaborense]|uniref:Flavodoxin n=1 Tax=Treponema brennaborense (strain DSM 12168 / CIP 105900 / DD5/3) TaxID=906968 RepID=F4LLW3_TREBD|nr:flavodoxin [Treponema brennaborense]AEE15655.1 flavodoxin [Treponema brennaborense DSM 12168]